MTTLTPRGSASPEATGRIRLPDGRRLGWSSWGSADTVPVLFFTGAGMSGRLGFATDLLHDRGIRLVAVDRPGVGRSDPDSGRSLESWADDVAWVLQAHDVTSATMIAFSQGAPFGLACAAAGLTDRLVIVSGQDDFGHAATLAQAPEEVAQLVRAVRTEPEEVHAAMVAMGTPDAIVELVDSTSSAFDRLVYGHRDFAPAYRACLTEGLIHGPYGYATDVLLALGPWPFDVEDITTPVILWYGAHDDSAVHSPDGGATLSARLPNATRHVVEDGGGSLLWTHADLILDALYPTTGRADATSPASSR